MEGEINLLGKEKDLAMLRKFGCKVDLDELDEALGKNLIAEMHFIPFELQQKLDAKLVTLRKKLKEKKEAYTGRLAENTKRLAIKRISSIDYITASYHFG